MNVVMPAPPPVNIPYVLWDLFWFSEHRKKQEATRQLQAARAVSAANKAMESLEGGGLRTMLHASLRRQREQDAASLEAISSSIPAAISALGHETSQVQPRPCPERCGAPSAALLGALPCTEAHARLFDSMDGVQQTSHM